MLYIIIYTYHREKEIEMNTNTFRLTSILKLSSLGILAPYVQHKNRDNKQEAHHQNRNRPSAKERMINKRYQQLLVHCFGKTIKGLTQQHNNYYHDKR